MNVADISTLTAEAIKAALQLNWDKAIQLNLQILDLSANNIEALCRLAKAYTEKGQFKAAKKTYRRVLKLDRFNPIAKRNLVRIKKKVKVSPTLHKPMKANLFLEIPGKTKNVKLVRLTSPKILLLHNITDEVKLKIKKRSVVIQNQKGAYLGRIPDDLSQRLISLVKRGNSYSAIIKSVDEKNLEIFIKEVKRSKKNDGFPSFPTAPDQYYTFFDAQAINKIPFQANNL